MGRQHIRQADESPPHVTAARPPATKRRAAPSRQRKSPGFRRRRPLARSRAFERLESRTLLAADVIVNEIMYHPSSGDVGQEYIELYNRATGPAGTDTANLIGWKFDSGVDFTFTNGTLAPGQYLVVAADLAKFSAKYPAVNPSIVFGPWTGSLSNNHETIELVDATGAVVDSVSYASQGDWATREHDRGVSLVGGITRSGTTATVTLFGHGYSNGDSVQIFGADQPEYNGTFTISNVTSTTFQYTLSGSPATPATGTIYARQMTDLTHSGWSWVSFADGLGKSLELINPQLSNNDGQNWASSITVQGTPGAPNSVLNTNIAPEILDLQQLPLIPKSTEAVTVTTRIVDELGTAASATLFYRLDAASPGAFTSVTMHDDGTAGDVTAGDGVWTAIIPPQANNAIVEYYVSATDGVKTRTWPAATNLGVQGANLLYQVDDTVYTGTQPLFKLIMTANERAELAALSAPGSSTDESNAQFNGTFISVDPTGSEIHDTVGIRNRGGGSRDATINNYRVDINNDHPFKKRTAVNLNAEYSMEDVLGSAIVRAAGLPTQNVVPVQVRVNNVNLASNSQFDMFGSYSWLEPEDSDYVDAHYPTDSAGDYYRGSSAAHTSTLAYLGTDPGAYVNNYPKQTNKEVNDWTDLINLTKAFDATQTPAANFVAAMNQNINVTEWLRYFAASTLIGDQETALSTGFGDDYSLYRGTLDTRFQVITHDLDTILGRGDTAGNLTESIFKATSIAAVNRLLKDQTFAPLYFGQLRDLINTTFSAATFNALLDNTLQSYVTQSVIDTMKTFAASRVANVLTQIPSAVTATSALTIQSGYPHATTATTSLTGTADAVKTRSVLVNGVAATWTAWTASWSAPTVPLNPGINRVLVQALDANNQEVGRAYIDIWRDTGTMTNVSGTLAAGTTTWTPAGGPYHVTANLTVPATGTLVIQPGTTVFFDAGVGLTVNGTLTALGTDTQRIRFTRTPTAASAWDKILISNTSGDSKIAYADQDWAGSGAENIQVSSARLDMDHMTWLNTTTHIVDFVNSSFRLTNSVIPTVVNVEPAHFHQMPAGGYALVQGNTFGTTTGHNDIFDFTGGKRPGSIFQVLDNVFLGTGTNGAIADDILDIDGTDAHVEGNVFMNVPSSGMADTNSAISGGNNADFGPTTTSNVVSVRNFFYNVDHAFLMKEGNTITSINDTMVHVLTGVFNFDEPGFAASKGLGGFADGDIFYDVPMVSGVPTIVQNAPSGTFTVSHSITPGAAPYAGIGNSNLDPQLLNTTNVTDPRTDFVLRPGPGPAVGTGPNGRDMGAAVLGGATIAGEPTSPTYLSSATLTVGGPDIYAYKYRVNGGAWSAEIATSNPGTVNASIPPIVLTGLANGSYTVDVVEKNSAGFYQADTAATHSKTWTVNTALAPHVRLNEILARNVSAVNHNGAFPDLIELYNDGQGTADLSGMSISDNPAQPQRYVFPGGTTLGQGQYLVLYGDSVVEPGAIHIGFGLKGSGQTVTLYDTVAHGAGVIDTVAFGEQLDDLSIGRNASGAWTLTTPTFGAANVTKPLGDPSLLKINEWLAHGVAPFTNDFIELYNPDTLPVNMGGLSLTDQPTGWPTRDQIAPLSFVAGSGYMVFTTDGDVSKGNDHANFKLASDQGEIGLFGATGSRIDSVIYFTQRDGVSQGRTPDGGPSYSFFAVPSPGVSNPAAVVTTQTTNLIAFDSSNWKYNQTDSFADQSWTATGYNDSTANWAIGQSLIYNDPTPDNNAAVTYANTFRHTQINAVNSPRITDYFRRHFTYSGNLSSVTALNLKTMIDDGGVVYLNGHEILRIAMPTGSVTATTLSNRITPWDSQLEDWGNVGSQWLVSGDNVIAVEVHQKSSSSDVGLAVQLDVVTTVTAVPSPIRITELNYHPPGGGAYTPDDFEYIELKNTGTQSVSLSGMSLAAGVSFVFPNGANSVLAAGASLVVVKNTAAFTARYGAGVQIAGQYTGDLDDVGEEIRLLDVSNVIVQDFTYSNTWYPSTDGQGYSLTIVNPAADPSTWSSPTSWRASKFILGSPGAGEASLAAGAVVINELLAHSHSDLATGDWIELKNTTAAPIDISGWYLTDSAANSFKYQIPAGTIIPAFGFKTFTEAADFGSATNPAALVPFGFSEDGEDAYLSASSSPGTLSGFRDGVSFAASESDVPFGRYTTSTGRVDFVAMSAPTFGAANAYPKVGPIVINELMYHPVSTGDEYLELRNITGHTVPLYDPDNPANTWQLTDGVTYVFPQGVTIPSNGMALVVPIDPATFRTKYSIPAAVQIFGPYSGALNNAGENIAISAPLSPEPGIPLSYYVEDQVTYDDAAPWPTVADGNGPSLERKFALNYSNDVANWVAGPTGGTPGATNAVTTFSSIAGRTEFYNNSAFDGNNAAANASDDAAMASDKQPLFPGQTASFANYTSFSKGINGLMIDVTGLPSAGATLSADDFTFKVGNDANPAAWIVAPTPIGISVRAGAGTAGADRITIDWPDGAIQNQWLQVTVKAEAKTGLANPDVFYFGNAVGETGDSPSDAQVTMADLTGITTHPRSIFSPATIVDHYDINRDRSVNANDAILARQNQAASLALFTAPGGGGGGMSPAAAPAAVASASASLAAAPLAVSALESSPIAVSIADTLSAAQSVTTARPKTPPKLALDRLTNDTGRLAMTNRAKEGQASTTAVNLQSPTLRALLPHAVDFLMAQTDSTSHRLAGRPTNKGANVKDDNPQFKSSLAGIAQ